MQIHFEVINDHAFFRRQPLVQDTMQEKKKTKIQKNLDA